MSDTVIEFKDIIKTFPVGWGEIEYSNHNNGEYIWITKPHNKDLNSKIKAHIDRKFFTTIIFGFDQNDKQENDLVIPVNLRLNLCWQDESSNYLLSMPKEVKIINCPVSYDDVLLCYWDIKNKKLIDKNKNEINIVDKIDKIYKKSLHPLDPCFGIPVRIKRCFIWNILYSFVRIMIFITNKIYCILTGEKIIVDQNYDFSYYLMKDDKKPELIISESKAKKIDFYGIKIKLIPLVTYSCIHLVAYGVHCFYPFVPIFITKIFTNAFLTILYVILSLSFMEHILANILKFISKCWVNLMRLILNSIVPQYDNKKLKRKSI